MAESAAELAGRIFISYRRGETAYPAGWLFDRLVQHFGAVQIFKDVDSIELGDDFVEVITRAVGSCDVLLALIGDQWLTVTDVNGRRRIDDPDDFVRLEIQAALDTQRPNHSDPGRRGKDASRRGSAGWTGRLGASSSSRAQPQPFRVRHQSTTQSTRRDPR